MKKDKRKTTKYQPIYRTWKKENGKYKLIDNVFGFEDDFKEYSLLLSDSEGKEIFEFDLLEDEKGIYLIKFHKGSYIKHYKTGEIEKTDIITFEPGKIVGNKLERGMM